MRAPGRHRGVLPPPVEVGVVIGHVSAQPCAAQAAKQAGWTSVRAEQTKQKRSTSDLTYHAAIQFPPYAVETCGYTGMHAARLANRVGDIAAESECIPGGACVRWTMHLLPVRGRGRAEKCLSDELPQRAGLAGSCMMSDLIFFFWVTRIRFHCC